MSAETRKGLPIQALGLINGREGVSAGKKTYIVPYADSNGRVVFVGRAAETATMILGTYGDQTVTEASIANRFETEWRGVRTLVSAVREGLEIADIDLKIGRDKYRYFLAPREEAGIDAGNESNMPSLKGTISYEIPTKGKHYLTLEGSAAETFEHFWNYQEEPLSNLLNRVKKLNRVLENSKTGIAVVREGEEYMLELNDDVQKRIREVWTIDVDDRPFIHHAPVEVPKRGDIWPAEDYGLLETEATVAEPPKVRKKRRKGINHPVMKINESERERIRSRLEHIGYAIRITFFTETDEERKETYPDEEGEDFIR